MSKHNKHHQFRTVQGKWLLPVTFLHPERYVKLILETHATQTEPCGKGLDQKAEGLRARLRWAADSLAFNLAFRFMQSLILLSCRCPWELSFPMLPIQPSLAN